MTHPHRTVRRRLRVWRTRRHLEDAVAERRAELAARLDTLTVADLAIIGHALQDRIRLHPDSPDGTGAKLVYAKICRGPLGPRP